MSDIILKLKAYYFKNASFISNSSCPVAQAIRNQLNAQDIIVLTYGASINGDPYKLSYWAHDFDNDLEKAKVAGFDDSVIRELTLARVASAFEFDMSSPYEED